VKNFTSDIARSIRSWHDKSMTAGMPPRMLKEFEFYIKHQDDLLQRFHGKFIAIKGAEILGGFETEIQAITEAKKRWDLGTFMVQKCEPGSENYTQVFHSRISRGLSGVHAPEEFYRIGARTTQGTGLRMSHCRRL
jgi:hypothetical protein